MTKNGKNGENDEKSNLCVIFSGVMGITRPNFLESTYPLTQVYILCNEDNSTQ